MTYAVVRYDARTNSYLPVSRIYKVRNAAFRLAEKMNATAIGFPLAVLITSSDERTQS